MNWGLPCPLVLQYRGNSIPGIAKKTLISVLAVNDFRDTFSKIGKSECPSQIARKLGNKVIRQSFRGRFFGGLIMTSACETWVYPTHPHAIPLDFTYRANPLPLRRLGAPWSFAVVYIAVAIANNYIQIVNSKTPWDENPLFLYVSHQSVHIPLQDTPEGKRYGNFLFWRGRRKSFFKSLDCFLTHHLNKFRGGAVFWWNVQPSPNHCVSK